MDGFCQFLYNCLHDFGNIYKLLNILETYAYLLFVIFLQKYVVFIPLFEKKMFLKVSILIFVISEYTNLRIYIDRKETILISTISS